MKFKHLALGLAFCGASAFADTHGGSVGVQAGWGMPLGEESLGGGLAVGATTIYMLNPEWGVGAFVTYNKLSPEADGVSSSFLPFGVNLDYHFTDVWYAGPNLGWSRTSVSSDAAGFVDTSSTDFTAGAQGGFHYPVADNMMAGVEARYLRVFADDAANFLQILGQLRFTF